MTEDKSEKEGREKDIQEARSVLRGKTAEAEKLFELGKKLKTWKEFSLARRILARARKAPGINDHLDKRVKIIQQHALCTYKDTDLPVDARLDSAFEILKETGEDLNTTTDQETLGLAGAIYKRKWEVDGRRQHLERSLAYYRRGYEKGVVLDDGYTAINVAFVLDLLADREEAEAIDAGAASQSANLRHDEARSIREDIVSKLLEKLAKDPKKEQDWWFLVTIAEAYFGLEQYEEAGQWLKKARNLQNVSEWGFESTARQLAALALLHDKGLKKWMQSEELNKWMQYEGSKKETQNQNSKEWTENKDSKEQAEYYCPPAWRVLYEELLGKKNAAGVRTAFTGKVGLALSGGGFRASLFHIGVLARLAELDILRHVEVLSCVSGGSIIGAHYYLELRKLLEEKGDADIERGDYIKIVQQIEKDFLDGVQRNIRTRAAADWRLNLKMVFSDDYSRTHRVGELYEKEIFSKVKDGEGDNDRWLNNLFINPKDETKEFRPKNDNWRRMAKVPILVLNATTLNTGHNWQFTASWIGEPPAGINTEIDGNDYLRRMYYGEAPEKYKNIRLGYAVAASSCVPGLFEPLVLPDLYPNRIVRLVDGGVQDNQGLYALLEQDCSVFLVSDASGQMESQSNPSAGTLGVPLRTLDILMARVREAQYRELHARRRSELARGFMFVHLKKDLDVDPVDWIYCQDPYEASDEARPAERRGVLTCYGILREVQKRLAAIRTDLDSFCDKEAYALMMSGYKMTEYEFPRTIEGFPPPQENQRVKWCFFSVEGDMIGKEGLERSYHNLASLLDVAKHKGFKIWRLSRPLRIIAKALGAIGLVILVWLCWKFRSTPLVTVGTIFWTALIMVVGASVLGIILRIVRYRNTLTQTALRLGAAIIGYIAANIHLHFFDRWYLRRGRVSTEEPSAKPPGEAVST